MPSTRRHPTSLPAARTRIGEPLVAAQLRLTEELKNRLEAVSKRLTVVVADVREHLDSIVGMAPGENDTAIGPAGAPTMASELTCLASGLERAVLELERETDRLRTI